MKGEIAYLVTLSAWAAVLFAYAVISDRLDERRAAKRAQKP